MMASTAKLLISSPPLTANSRSSLLRAASRQAEFSSAITSGATCWHSRCFVGVPRLALSSNGGGCAPAAAGTSSITTSRTHPCPIHHLSSSRHERLVSPFATRYSSTSFSPVGWWRDRQEKKEADKYMQRIEYMSNKEAWTIGDMKEELDEVVSSWTSKIPVVSDNKETKLAKQMHKTITGLASVVGGGATEETLGNMSRPDKLRAAVEGETTVDEINALIQQFQTMSLMHRVLRKRREAGKPIPKTAEAMQAVIQAEGPKLLSKTQRSRMVANQARSMRKSGRRR